MLFRSKPIAHRIVKPEAGRDKSKPETFGKAYVDGNVVVGNTQVTQNNWDGGVQIHNQPNADGYIDQIKVDVPFEMPHVTIMDANTAYEFVLENVGATFPKRDAVDERIVKSVRTGEAVYVHDAQPYETPYVKRRLPADSYKLGIITHIDQVGGLPSYSGEAYIDTDGDGIPDEWEIKYGLNPNDPSDANQDMNGDGYTNIEKYINGIDRKSVV